MHGAWQGMALWVARANCSCSVQPSLTLIYSCPPACQAAWRANGVVPVGERPHQLGCAARPVASTSVVFLPPTHVTPSDFGFNTSMQHLYTDHGQRGGGEGIQPAPALCRRWQWRGLLTQAPKYGDCWTGFAGPRTRVFGVPVPA